MSIVSHARSFIMERSVNIAPSLDVATAKRKHLASFSGMEFAFAPLRGAVVLIGYLSRPLPASYNLEVGRTGPRDRAAARLPLRMGKRPTGASRTPAHHQPIIDAHSGTAPCGEYVDHYLLRGSQLRPKNRIPSHALLVRLSAYSGSMSHQALSHSPFGSIQQLVS